MGDDLRRGWAASRLRRVGSRIAAPLLLGVGLTLATAGCTGSAVDPATPSAAAVVATRSAPASATPVSTAASPETSSTVRTTPAPVSTVRVAFPQAALPSAFPLPVGARITNTVRTGRSISATVALSSAATPADLSRSLTAAGYRVAGTHDDGGLGEVLFSGPGCVAGSQIAVAGNSLAVQCLAG